MPELHISSLVVQVRPEALARVTEAVAALDGAEVHGHGPTGKLVVTLETASEAVTLERLTAINQLEGVLSAVLVYHHVDPSTPSPEVLPWSSPVAS